MSDAMSTLVESVLGKHGPALDCDGQYAAKCTCDRWSEDDLWNPLVSPPQLNVHLADVIATAAAASSTTVPTCRTFSADGMESLCDQPARYIVWGHLFDKADKGPKCFAHAPKPRAGNNSVELDFVAVMPHNAIYEIPLAGGPHIIDDVTTLLRLNASTPLECADGSLKRVEDFIVLDLTLVDWSRYLPATVLAAGPNRSR